MPLTTSHTKPLSYLYKTIIGCAALLIVFIHTAAAQQADSLRAALHAYTTADTNRMNLLVKLAILYRDDNPDSLLAISARGYALAGALHSYKGKATFTRNNGIAWYRKNDFDKAFDAYNTSLDLFVKAGDQRGQSSVLLSIADIYYRQAKYSTAIEYYNKGIAVAQQSNTLVNIGLGLTSIGGIYSDLGSYTEALQYYLKGLGVFEKATFAQGISMSYTNIATIYSDMGDNVRALDYINKSMVMAEREGNKEGKLFNLVNASGVYNKMGDYKACLATCKQALNVADSLGDDNWHNVCLNNLADAHYLLGHYDSALAAYTTVLQKADAIKDIAMQIAAHKGIGLVAGKHGNIALSITELEKAYRIARANGVKESAMSGAMDLSNIYERANKYHDAMQYRDIYYTYKDSIYSDKNNRHIQQLQFDYELDKKQKELEQQKTIAHERRQRNKAIEWSLSGGLVLLIVIVVLLYRSRLYDRRIKARLLLHNKEVEAQAAKLQDLNEFKDKTFSILSHDLRGPVNSFTATVMLLNEQQISTEDFDTMKPELTRQVSSLNLLLDNVLGWARSHMQGEMPARPVKTNIYHIAQQNLMMLQDTAARKEISLVNNIAETTYAVCDEAQADIVLRNLVMNAIKYTNRSGSITMSATTREQDVLIMVSDTGIGMSAEQISKLFTTRQENTNTYGTEGEKGIGLGLVLCYEFVKANKGSISVTSEPGKGSTFTVSLPRFKSV